MNKSGVIGVIFLAVTGAVQADDKKSNSKSEPARPTARADADARGPIGGQPRFVPSARGVDPRRFPTAVNVPNRLPNVTIQNRNLPRQPGATTNLPVVNRLGSPLNQPRSRSIDETLATNWRLPRRGDVTAIKPKVPQTPEDGEVVTGRNKTPTTDTARRHRGGTRVVPFNNDNTTTFTDAHRRCHDWRNRNCDRRWWRNRCNIIILIGGGYYAWDAGWWYPAWGYSSTYSYYPYDGPIYGYDGLPPDQVIANVQSVLQELGYYPYAVDGVLGPATQAAIAEYQRDNGLSVTAAIDRPTLASMGFIY